jgi:ribonuclease HII
MLAYERALWKSGLEWVAGVDEAGRGPLAGPVVAACVVLPRRASGKLKGLTDSKQLKPAQRDHYFDRLFEVAVAIGVGEASCSEIDNINILQATFLAMRRALDQIERADHVLVDGNRPIPQLSCPQQAIVKGDGLSLSIAAASVIAKVTRDRAMEALHAAYPVYGFDSHKGYGTKAHYAAIAEHGLTPHHRLSFLKGVAGAGSML